ncbi:MAG: putative metalloprotease CJM1_0395 family protein [Methyloligellaceae bacterium]
MISALGAGNIAYAGSSSQVFSGRDSSEVGVNSNSNRSVSPYLDKDSKVNNLRVVEETGEAAKSKSDTEELSEEEEQQVRELKQRDTEVKAHEQAHATVGGSYASAPSYEYTVGPDGKRYATSGEVQIDASPVRDNPEATIRKMDIVIRAALAPAEPSSQDLQVAKQAQATRSKAQAELQKKSLEEQKGGEGEKEEGSDVRLVAEAAYKDADSLIFQTIAESHTAGSSFSTVV